MLIFTSVIGGCTSHFKPPIDTLVVALDALPATLDPRYATDANGMRLSDLIFSSLVHLGPNLEPAAEAAEKWTYDHHAYTFYLRRDLRFHNGRQLEADDVRFSFAQYLAPGGPFSSALDLIKTVQVSEKNTQIVVRIELRYFSDKFLKSDLPSIKLLPKKEIMADPEKFGEQLPGTGPLRLAWKDSSAIALDSVDGRAATPHIVFKIIRDDFTRYQKTLKGEVDIAQMEISPDKVGEFQKRPTEFAVFIYPGLSMSYLLVNFNDPFLRQLKVRQALAQSIDREEIIRYKLHGLAQQATSLLTPSNSYFNTGLKNLPFALDDAREKLKSLDLHDQSLMLKTSNTPQAVDNGKVLAYQMSRSGLKVKMQSYEWGTFYNDVKHGNFQLASMRWVGTVDPDLYRMALHSNEKPPGRNRGSYSNPELDQLLNVGTMEEDLAVRHRLFNHIQELVLNDLAIIPLWYDQQIAVARRCVVDYHPNPTGNFWPLLEAKKVHD